MFRVVTLNPRAGITLIGQLVGTTTRIEGWKAALGAMFMDAVALVGQPRLAMVILRLGGTVASFWRRTAVVVRL